MTTLTTQRIFISYRRADTAGYAGRIYDRLSARYGNQAIFMDVVDIGAGEDFVRVLEDAVQKCDVLIALIGKQWLEVKDKDGNRRLDNPKDFVRIEIATALKRGVRVVPVLIGGAAMPSEYQLPRDLKMLSWRHAISLDHDSFVNDLSRLMENLEVALQDAEDSRLLKQIRVQEKLNQVENALKESQRRKAQQERTEKVKKSLKAFVISAVIVVSVIAVLFGGRYLIRTLTPYETPLPINSISTEIPATETLSFSDTAVPPVEIEPPASSLDSPVSPDVGSIRVSEKDGMTMLYVPDGYFLMGSDRQNDEKPIHEVYVGAYWIDQTEITNSMYAACVNAGACNRPSDTSRYYGKLEFADSPVIWVSWEDADAYCVWAERRLLTENEWEKAAGWTKANQAQQMYPWGNKFDGRKVNFCDVNCSRDWREQNYNDAYMEISPVGSYENGKSFYGVYDMSGNVMEWVDTWYDIYPDGDLKVSDYFGTTLKVIRGGSYLSDRYFISTSRRHKANPRTPFVDVGFRCAMDAD